MKTKRNFQDTKKFQTTLLGVKGENKSVEAEKTNDIISNSTLISLSLSDEADDEKANLEASPLLQTLSSSPKKPRPFQKKIEDNKKIDIINKDKKSNKIKRTWEEKASKEEAAALDFCDERETNVKFYINELFHKVLLRQFHPYLIVIIQKEMSC